MENNEIVRSLKFYCDAIFKYDYEKGSAHISSNAHRIHAAVFFFI